MSDALSLSIIEKAKAIGFYDCGISEANALIAETDIIERWIQQGCHGEMEYLERNKDKRYDPRLLVEGTKTIISVILSYYPQSVLPDKDNYKISKYAYGADYHYVIKAKLQELLQYIESNVGKLNNVRSFVDSAPILDRAWARRAGLGFIGKNTMLIHPKLGSFFFIGHLFLPIKIAPQGKVIPNHCGTCTRCIEACPTQALTPFAVDARRCLSYLTIEHRGPLNEIPASQFQDWIFGCDTCQDVCPWNKFSQVTNEASFQPKPELYEMTKDSWHNLTEEQYKKLFKNSAVNRTGYKGLMRNIKHLNT